MSQTDCPASIQACAMRIALLDPTTKAPVSGATAGYVTNAFTEFTFSPEIESGTVIEIKSACGSIHNPYRDPDTVKRWNISFVTENPDPEVHNLLIGAGLIAVAGNDEGMTAPRIGSQPNHVSLEFWSKAVVNGVQVATKPWLHWVFADAQVQMGERKAGNDQMLQPFAGFGAENANYGNGPWNDFPVGSAPLLAGWAVFRDATLPTSACGWTAVPAQG